MPHEEQSKDFIDLVSSGVFGASLAVLFKCICIVRRQPDGRPITWQQALVELSGAGAVGAVTSWCLESFRVNSQMSAVIIAMSGYVGGPLLDICYKEIQQLFQAVFDGVEKWIEDGKWKE